MRIKKRILCKIILLMFLLNIFYIPLTKVKAEEVSSTIKPYDDVSGKDLSNIDLREKSNLLFTLTFDTDTKWPSKDKMPKDFDPVEVIEHGKNPGLNVRKLHEQGYTGKGVSIAYVDQPLLEGHEEYKDVDLHYEKVADYGELTNPSMHGPAVLSLLAGKDVGIVPDSTVYFMGGGFCPGDQKNEAKGFQRIIEINKTLPKDKKIKIIGMSHRVADKNGYYLKNSDLLKKAQEDAEKEGIMVIDCDTFNDPILLAITPDKDVDNYRNYTIATKYTSNNPERKLCVPTSRAYASGYLNDKRQYIFTQAGGQSWSVPYIVGVIAMGLQVNPNLTKEQSMKYLYDSGYDFRGGKIINPEGFINMVKENYSNPHDVTLDKDYRYFLYNKNAVTQNDLNSINEYVDKFNDSTTSILKDVSSYTSATEIYDMLKNDSKNRNGQLKGIQIFGDSNVIPAFDIHFKVQMQNGIDDSGNFKSDFFYSNFKNDSNILNNDFSIYKAFNDKLNISFVSEWIVSRLPLTKGEIAPFMERNNQYVEQINDMPFGNFVNFSNPIFAQENHSDDFGYFLKEKIDKEFNILSSNEYKLYGNKQGTYPVNTNVLGDFTKENIAKENKEGIKELIINTHGQWNNIDQAIFTSKDMKSEKRISFLNNSNINTVLSENFYDLDLWTCLNGYNLEDKNIVHEAMAKGKAMSAMAASSIISNNGVHNNVSLEEMKKDNFYYFYFNYFYNRALGKSRSESFSLSQQAYAEEIMKNRGTLLDGNYQFNLINVLSYHYFGLIEYWDIDGKDNFNPRLEGNEENTGNSNNHDSNYQSDLNGNIKFNSNYSNGGFKVNSFKAERIGNLVQFTLDYESSRDCDYSFFSPPNGDKFMKKIVNGIKKGKDTSKFNLTIDEFNKVLSADSIAMRFGFDDRPNWIDFNPAQLKVLLNSTNITRKVVNENDFVLLKELGDVDANKDWTISLTNSIDKNDLDNSKIFVLDETNQLVDVNISLKPNDDKKIMVKHINSYEAGKTYKLYITKDFKSKNKHNLPNGIVLKFTIIR